MLPEYDVAVSVTSRPTTSSGRQKDPTQGSPLMDLRVDLGNHPAARPPRTLIQ